MARLVRGRGGRASALITGVANLVSQAAPTPPATDFDVVNTFVVDPLAIITPVLPNVFNTFAPAVAYASNYQGSKRYWFRGTAPVIAAGAYNLGQDPILIQGDVLAVLSIAAGATFTGNTAVIEFDISQVTYAGATPLIVAPTFAAGGGLYRFRNNCSLRCTDPAGRLVQAPAGTFASCRLAEGSSAFAGTVFEATGGGVLQLWVVDRSSVITNTLSDGGGTGTLAVQSDGSANSITLAQALVATGLLVVGGNLSVEGSTNNLRGPGGASPALQSGTATLIGGKLQITANLTASSVIQLTCKIPRTTTSTSFYAYNLPAFPIVTGLAGHFTICAVLIGADTINIADVSDIGWLVIN